MKQIKLTQNQFALVDDDKYDFINQWKWHAVKSKGTYYARRYDCSNGGKVGIRMQDLVIGKLNGFVADHKDGNGLNNQRNNLRTCTYRQNSINRSGWGSSKYLGVSFEKCTHKWIARINTGDKKINIGRFKVEENAAIAYNIYAEKYHGEFARFNTAST